MRLILSIGTNMGDRMSMIRRSLHLLETAGNVETVSAAYETSPWGFVSQHKFINIALTIDTPLSAEEALEATQTVERQLGRTTKSHNGYTDRPIDIDLIDAGGVILDTPRLILPHPLMQQRNFVLYPLCDIAPQWYHPILKLTASELKRLSPDKEIPQKLDFIP
ncbi:MAG: 2-amino-4-hydroxy-6-hydroxymethyldihydropteridine diphosphokinase [Candidatus Aphodosoma sp.]